MKRTSISPDQSGVAEFSIRKIVGERESSLEDQLAIEEPLEIRLEFGPASRRLTQSISITMRTPGYDFELAAGFLFTEGIVKDSADWTGIEYCGPKPRVNEFTNTVKVELKPEVKIDLAKLQRHFYTSSSCGVCGKSSIEALRTQSRFPPAKPSFSISKSFIHALPARLRESQGIFDSTGGLHASALFSETGELLILREDVGRHNALDKLIGQGLLQDALPFQNRILMVSGRASFELIQKASMAGVEVFAAVGAPSSLAVQLAEETGMTLLGFVRDHRFNVYSGANRITS